MQFTVNRKLLIPALAVLVAIPVLIFGGRAVAAATCFSDVDDSKWYETFVCWAADEGIVNGFPDGTFRPEENVTRAEVTAIAQRLAFSGHPTIAAKTSGTAITDTSADTTWRDMPGGSLLIDLPAPGALVTARFTAESQCDGGDYASIRILVDGAEMGPVVGEDFAFDSSDGATETASSWESHATERTATDIAAGLRTVKVQWNSGCTNFRIDDWSLVVTSWPAGTYYDGAAPLGVGQGGESQR